MRRRASQSLLGLTLIRIERAIPDRHRYFDPGFVEQRGANEIQSLIILSLVHSARRLPAGAVADPTDVQRAAQLEHLRSRVANAKGLTAEEANVLLEDTEMALRRAEEAEARIRAEEDTRRAAEAKADAMEHALREIERGSQAALVAAEVDISALPASVEEVLEMVVSLRPNHLYATEEALRSARRASFSDIHEAWRILWKMGTVLWRLRIEENLGGKALDDAFRAETGIEHASTERSATKKDKRLMDLRILHYEGEDHDMSPHLKLGSQPPNLLRIHYAVVDGMLVIGHCGGHLDTAGTRRMR